MEQTGTYIPPIPLLYQTAEFVQAASLNSILTDSFFQHHPLQPGTSFAILQAFVPADGSATSLSNI